MRSVFVSAVIVASLLVACSSDSASSSTSDGGSSGGGGGGGGTGGGTGSYVGKSESGVATYYDADGSGNCSFDPSPNDLDVAAMDAPEYANSDVCGECVAVTGPKGSVTVRIVDQCPECEAGHLDLSESAFEKIADKSAGRVPITWNVIECNVSGNLTYHYKDGTSQYWTAIQVRNSRLPIASLEVQSNGTFTKVDRQSYNYFVDAAGAGAGPVTVRVTSIDGQQITDTLPAPSSDSSSPGSAQFE
ncbi:MAG TPA: expansin EXLX1 family cellulose-binding protein [Polyangiaceae bacterium]